MNPVELLEQELKKYERALYHLEIFLEKNDVDKETYDRRKNNLLPIIQNYKFAINILKSHVD